MKFSDMMGKGDKGSTITEETTEVTSESAEVPAEIAESPIRFGDARTEAPPTEAPTPLEPVAAPIDATEDRGYALRDVVAELAPSARITPTVASDQEIDATSWLEGLTSIDDDLLPR